MGTCQGRGFPGPRAGSGGVGERTPVFQEASCKNHRVNRVVFLGSTKRLLTTGVSRWNTRQIALWDQVGAETPAPFAIGTPAPFPTGTPDPSPLGLQLHPHWDPSSIPPGTPAQQEHRDILTKCFMLLCRKTCPCP